MARKPTRFLSVAELAETQGVDVDTALKRLKALARRSGVAVLFRLSSGRRAPWYTTRELLQRADPRWLEEHQMLVSDVEALKKKTAEQEEKIRNLRARVRDLEAHAASR